jgi:hypothetical protein
VGCAIAGIIQRGEVCRSGLLMSFMYWLTNLGTTVLCRLSSRLHIYILSDIRSAHCVICCHHGLDWKLICPRHATAFLFMPSTHTQTHKTTLLAPACQPCYSSARAFFHEKRRTNTCYARVGPELPRRSACAAYQTRKISAVYLQHPGYVHR